MAIFSLTITSRSSAFGATPDGERQAVAQLLHRAAQQIGSGALPQSGQNVPEIGNVNASNCSWSFGAGSMNAPVAPANGGVAGGTAVTIKGSGFNGVTAVSFGGVAATSVVVVDDATITCVTGAHVAGAVDVVIGTPGRQTLLAAFTYS